MNRHRVGHLQLRFLSACLSVPGRGTRSSARRIPSILQARSTRRDWCQRNSPVTQTSSGETFERRRERDARDCQKRKSD
jgi:hypothetical protein